MTKTILDGSTLAVYALIPAKITCCHDVTFSRLAALSAMPFSLLLLAWFLFISYCGTVHFIPETPQPVLYRSFARKWPMPLPLQPEPNRHFCLQTINKNKSMPEERLSFPPVTPKLKLVLKRG